MSAKTISKPQIEWWPVSIIAFFALAISGAVAFVVFCSTNPSELVTRDYYEQELRYQDQLDRQQRTRELGGTVGLNHDAGGITIRLPATQVPSCISGLIHLYRPSSAGMDRRVKLAVDQEGRQRIETRLLEPGLWKLRIQWTAGSEHYQFEEAFVLGAGKNS